MQRAARLLFLAALTLACQPAAAPPPNVVVILLDTLRPDYLGFYGHEEEKAPFLAELAERAVVFERAFSTSSWTAPSTASLFTSLYPHQHGVVEGFVMRQARAKREKKAGIEALALNRLPADVATLPEVFQSLGYATFGLAANINIGDEIGFDRGFDRFERDSEADAEFFLDRVLQWREEIHGTKPFFLYLHLNDVHEPYRKRAPYYEKQTDAAADRRARYLSELAYADAHLRTIYEQLDLGTNTVVIALSDHGEEFGDHGGLGHPATLHVELNRVLMMIHAPRAEPRRVTRNVGLIDVLPTLVELAGGAEAAEARDWQGVSLVPLLRDSERTEALDHTLRDRTLFAHRMNRNLEQEPLWAATLRHWKLIESPGKPPQLYDHRDDPAEKRDLYSADTQKIATPLGHAIEAFKQQGLAAEPDRVEVEVDPKLEKQLRSLGYVD
jgi:arylsulfatase A-like enzyme